MNTRCITLDGDDFNPGGTLTGGSRSKGSSVLARLHELSTTEAELAMHQAAQHQADHALAALAAVAKDHKQ